MAILEDDRLVELLVDRPDHRRSVGDIYLGRVDAVLPGIQAAFVDIGQEKSAFLHASDLLEPEEDDDPSERDDADDDLPDGEEAEGGDEGEAVPQQARKRRGDGGRREVGSRRAVPDISEILKKGQTLPVQVTKEPISTKGSRVTAQISIAGRFLVYMPYASKVGVSRKIESREQRAKLRELVSEMLPKDAGGMIVRT
ncbi:MAG TPA: ribonuclease E/G, partial [Gemmatimonadales bacterium]|nr:ribonuclease E/G [Gemmatimonadales bacterium]